MIAEKWSLTGFMTKDLFAVAKGYSVTRAPADSRAARGLLALANLNINQRHTYES